MNRKPPSDWKLKKLKQLVLPKEGIRRGPFGGALKKETFVENGFKVYQQGNAIREDWDYGDYFIDTEKYNEMSAFHVQPGDFLVSCSGTIGRIVIVPKTARPGVINQALLRIRLNQTIIDPLYFLYQFRSDEMQRVIVDSTQGGAMQNLVAMSIFKEVVFALPPIPEQRKIVVILSTWDDAIALTERCIEAARQRKKGLMRRLLTGRVRFPEFEGEEWREVRLGKVFTERKERSYEDLPLLSVAADEGIIYRDELERRDTSSADKSKYLRVCKGDIAYNTMRMWQGRSGVSRLEGIVSPAYTVCKPKPSIDSDFMGYLFQLPSVVYLFRRYSQGLVSDMWNLKFKHFAQIHIRIPETREQHRVAAVLRTCDREIELLIQKRDALQRQKKGLMQRLLTGRVRVEV
jgi:type I restriction enzyme S subunit